MLVIGDFGERLETKIYDIMMIYRKMTSVAR